MGLADMVGDKSAEDFALVLFRDRFDTRKGRFGAYQSLSGERFQPGIQGKNIGIQEKAPFYVSVTLLRGEAGCLQSSPHPPQSTKPSRSYRRRAVSFFGQISTCFPSS